IQPYWDRQAWDREEDIRATAERLNALAPLASEAGLRVGYHNHEFEARPIFDGRCGLEVLVDHLDPGWCSNWTPSGARSAARIRPRCSSGWDSGCSSPISRTDRSRATPGSSWYSARARWTSPRSCEIGRAHV